jgi:hypothetical protein
VDAFVAALGSDGHPLWQRRVSDVQQNDVTSVALDPCGNLLLAGSASRRAFVAEFDREGVPRDFLQIVGPGPKPDDANDLGVARILADPTGGMLVVGSLRGNASLAGTPIASASAREHDAFVARWSR